MTAAKPQPLNEENRASLEGLDDVFTGESFEAPLEETDDAQSDMSEDNLKEEDVDSGSLNDENLDSSLPNQNIDDSENQDDKPGTAVSKQSVQSKLAGALIDGEDRVARGDLVSLLEGFVGILKGEGDPNFGTSLARASKSPPEELKFTDVAVEDKTAELEDMRQLVVEAQDTIIKLLTDRVEDRSKIAILETELKLLPDLQEQADRAMAVAFKTEEFRTELHKVKYELEKSKLATIRKDMYKGPRGVLTKVQRWLLKAKGRSQLKFNDAVREESKSKEK